MSQSETSSFLPREIIKWLDSLDLAYAVRNVRRDLCNGFLVCEILSRYYPKEINIYTIYNGMKTEQKKDNWETISKILFKKEFIITQAEYEQIYFQVPHAAFKFILKLFSFFNPKKHLTTKKGGETIKDEKNVKSEIILNETRRNRENMPSYARPTAALLSKDRELTRIIDNDEKLKKTQFILEEHYAKNRLDKQNNNIIEYLLNKKKRQVEEDLKKQSLLLNERKKNDSDLNPPEIKEIPVKSFNTHVNKKKEQQQMFVEGRELMEFFTKFMYSYLEKEPMSSELKELKLDEHTNKIDFVLNNSREFTKKAIKVLLLGFRDNFEALIECLNNNYGEFKRFMLILLPVLEALPYNSKAFRVLSDLFSRIGCELVLLEPNSTQIFFETIALERLLQILKNYQNKYDKLIPIIYSFCQNESLSKLRIVKKIKDIVQTDLNFYLSILAHLVSYSVDDEMDGDFYDLFLYYSMIALEFPSPISRTNGLKIISEICTINYPPILSFMKKFEKLMKDDWWEVRAQIIVISANLLFRLSQEDAENLINESLLEQESQPNDPESAPPIKLTKEELLQKYLETKAENEKFLLRLIYEIFHIDSSNSILHIGLIYLSSILNNYPLLCDRYLEILIKVSEDIREAVLKNSPQDREFGYVVSGCKSFKYKLNGATLSWNSVGIVQSLNKFVKDQKLDNFEKEHLQILAGCFVGNLEEKDSEIWIEIFENLKSHIFLALCYEELCKLSCEILKKIFIFEKIQNQILKNSAKIFLKILGLIYHPDTQEKCRENLLDFFGYLRNENEIFKEYLYEIIKEFSEKSKQSFLKSNLVEFMNSLAKERRGKIFGAGFLI